MNQKTLDFIRHQAEADVRQLALQGCKDPEVDLTMALEQIAGWQAARTKLPSWAAVDGIVYPPHLSMEQCSSELTARYKAEVAGSGRKLVDLTGGFGVDSFTMSSHFEQTVYVERQPQLCAISSENIRALGLATVSVVNADGADYLHQLDSADVIFVDPARRDEHGARTYGIADCTPNVLELMDELVTKADRMLLKLSPMLDWRKAVADIEATGKARVGEVHIVSVDNECKELLVKVRKGESEKVRNNKIVCVNLLRDYTQEIFDFEVPFSPSHPLTLSPSHPLNFLFVPNASVMKAGCFDEIAGRFAISQLDSNSHLFVSDADVPDFPGRRFRIDGTTTMNKRELKATLAGIDCANIAVRNFPMSVAELRKRLKLKDGGSTFIFATTVANEGHKLYICRKIG